MFAPVGQYGGELMLKRSIVDHFGFKSGTTMLVNGNLSVIPNR